MTTQFISKVERQLVPNPPSTSNEVISSSSSFYEPMESIRRSLPGFAPFTTTSKRTSLINPASLTTPAPGSYNTTESFNKRSSTTCSAFKSKSSRFDQQQSISAPASISYNLKSDFDNIISKTKTKTGRNQIKPTTSNILEMIKTNYSQPAVPSIPNRDQSYGYEEDPTIGRLIPQYPLKSGFTGIKNDTVSPLDYNPKIDYTKFHNPPKVSFGKDKKDFMDRILRNAATAPGPGAYNTLSTFDTLDLKKSTDADFLSRLYAARRHQTSAFESKTKREPIKPKTDIPGPGSYYIPPAIQAPTPPPPERQSFASSGPRFKDNTSNSMVFDSNSAFNQYNNPVTSDFDRLKIKILKKKHILSQSTWAQHVAFATTENRFLSSHDKDDIPGPCYYDTKDSLADKIAKPSRKYRPFGTTGERFKEDNLLNRSNTNDEIAAKYFERDFNTMNNNNNNSALNNNKNTQKRLPMKLRYTSAFASGNSSNRFRSSVDEPLGPAPTAYDTQKVWTDTMKRGYRMKGPSIESRKEPEVLPGPMSYYIPPTIGETKSFNRKKVFLSTTSRQEKYDKDIPGPGSYNLETSLIRPSHNILLSESYQ